MTSLISSTGQGGAKLDMLSDRWTVAELDLVALADLAAGLCDAPFALLFSPEIGRHWSELDRAAIEPWLAVAERASRLAMAEAAAIVVPDLFEHGTLHGAASAAGPRFVAAVPVIGTDGSPSGAICVADAPARPLGLSADQLRRFDVLARRAAAYLPFGRRATPRAAGGELAAKGSITGAPFDSMFGSAVSFAMIATDADGCITHWNGGAEHILGWSATEMLGLSAACFFTPEDRAAGRVEAEMRIAREEGHADDERWHVRKDGSRFWASGEVMPLHDAANDLVGYLKILRDRTRRRQVDLRRSEDELRYRALLETVEVAFAIAEVKFDGNDRPIDYRFLEANPAFERQAGVDLRGKWVTEFAPNLERVWFETYGRVALTGRPEQFEHKAEAFGRWFDVRAQRIGDPAARHIAIFFTDATERHETQVRDATLLALGDRLSELDGLEDIAFAGCQTLGVNLRLSRAGFGVVDLASETTLIEHDWTARGASEHPGLLCLRDFGSFVDELKDGRVVAVNDVRTDPRTRHVDAALAARGIRAFVALPIIEQGRLVALLRIAQEDARTWSEADISLIREVAERTRAAVERSRLERLSRESEAQFRVLAEAAPNQIWISRPDGHVFWFNEQTYIYSGAMPGTLDGRAWTELVHSHDKAEAGAAWAQSLVSGATFEAHIRIRRHDGAYRWFLVRALPVWGDGAIVRWIGTNTDVDEGRRQAARLTFLNEALETEVAERTRERDRIWNSTSDLMGTAGLDGFLKAVNPAWTRMLGWTEHDLLSRPFIDFVNAADHGETADVVRRLSEGKTVTDFVDRVTQKSGGERVIMWDAVPNGQVFDIVGRDITALRHAEDQLRQSQKMEAVGQLTGGLAHDFNNLLTGITGSLDLMSARISQGRFNGLERYAAAAQGAAQRAAALTHRLLAFSRRQTLAPKPTDLNRLVAGLEELVRRTVGPAIAIEVVAADDLWPTLVDPNQLENALLNLCINARDAMPDGGRLTIATANHRLDVRAARERELSPGPYVSLCVSDTGTGMSPEVMAKAFDPFFTTKPLGQGTGLGLSMIYGFARQSGGQVHIDSAMGSGTSVCIFLPRHVGEVGASQVAPELARAPRAVAGETVLVVDDEPTVRMLVVEVLEELGYAAVEAADGASGLRILQSDAAIDLLVTDVGLPGGMDGRQMAEAAREWRPALKILFITGYAENAALCGGQLGTNMHVMTKPFALEALASRIKGILSDERQAWDAP